MKTRCASIALALLTALPTNHAYPLAPTRHLHPGIQTPESTATQAAIDAEHLHDQLESALGKLDPDAVTSVLSQAKREALTDDVLGGLLMTLTFQVRASAVRPGDYQARIIDAINPLFTFGYKPAQPDSVYYDQLLIVAAEGGACDIIRYLAGKGYDLNRPCRGGEVPLNAAYKYNQREAALLLQRLGANALNDDAMAQALLIGAINAGNNAEIRRLVKAGADPGAYELTGQLPLVEAARRYNEAAVWYFLEKGADPNKHTQDLFGLGLTQTALSAACGQGVLEIEDPSLPPLEQRRRESDDRTCAIVRLLVEYGARVNEMAFLPALHGAAQCGKVNTVRLLIGSGADVQMRCGGIGKALEVAKNPKVIEVLRAFDRTEK